VRQKRSDSQTT